MTFQLTFNHSRKLTATGLVKLDECFSLTILFADIIPHIYKFSRTMKSSSLDFIMLLTLVYIVCNAPRFTNTLHSINELYHEITQVWSATNSNF